jgi:hypothetical protein
MEEQRATKIDALPALANRRIEKRFIGCVEVYVKGRTLRSCAALAYSHLGKLRPSRGKTFSQRLKPHGFEQLTARLKPCPLRTEINQVSLE